MKQRSLFWLFVWSGLGIAILLALGTWQLFRLAEKRAFIAGIEEGLAAPALPIEQAGQQQNDTEFPKVELTGSFTGPNLYMQATFDGGPGWRVLTPFATPNRMVVLVDRGRIPASLREDASLNVRGPSKLQGFIRHYNRGQGLFDPDNDPAANSWYWWDVPAMLGSLDVPPDYGAANYIVQALPRQGEAILPKPDDVVSGIPNNHLGYAITWFSLAVCLAAMTALLARREIARRQA